MNNLHHRLQHVHLSYQEFTELHPEEQILVLANPTPKSIFMAYWLESAGIHRTQAGKHLRRMEEQGLILRKEYDWSKYDSHKHPGARGFLMTQKGIEARKTLIDGLRQKRYNEKLNKLQGTL